MNNKFTMKIRKSFTPCPVYVDGLSRSGKAAVGVALASLKRTEHILTRNILDRLFTLYSLGLLDRNAAIDSMITESDFKLWFNYLGRNLNTNIHDFTSVLNSRDPDMYKKRMNNQDNNETFEEFLAFLNKEKPITLDCTDEMLYESDLFFEAFENLFIVAVMRHPVDIAFGWHRTGRGNNYGVDPRTIHPTLLVEGKNVPIFAKDWAKEYIEMEPINRVLKIITILTTKYYDYIENLPEERKKSVYVLSFENFVTDPHPILEHICNLLGTGYSKSTPSMLEKANLPRKLNHESFFKKFFGLKNNGSEKLLDDFFDSCKRYEKMFDTPFRINEAVEDKSFNYSNDFNLYFKRPFYDSGKRVEDKN